MKERIKQIVLTMGIVLWIGVICPEIFIENGMGCLADENGEEISWEEASFLLGEVFEKEADTKVKLIYKSRLLELFAE